MEKSILEMVGGEKHIKPHYDIKAESTSCYPAATELRESRIKELEDALEYTRKLYGDELEKAYKENARMKEMLKTLNDSIVMTADDTFWSLRDDVEKFLEEC